MTGQPERSAYLSDLSNARWALMEPNLTAWRTERQKTSLGLGAPITDLREVMNAILYVNHTGIPWRYLPHDFPPPSTVFSYFSTWTTDGTIEMLGVRLRRVVREQVGRTAEPTACVIDAQSVKTAYTVPSSTQGIDAGKKIVGRKRSQHGAALGIDVDVVPRNTQVKGFSIVPRRWVVERTFGWIMMHRRLARDYETKPAHSESMIRLAMISNLLKRATGESAITWHNP